LKRSYAVLLMKRFRQTVILLPLIVLLGFQASLPATELREQTLGPDLQVREIAQRVWLHRSLQEVPGYGRVPSNGLLLAGGAQSLMIDTPWTVPQTQKLLDWADDTLGVPVAHLVVTHAHDDRMGGLAAALTRDVSTYASEETRILAKEGGLPQPELPIFEDARLTLAGFDVQIFFPGPGHSPDNIVVWFPVERVLFAGCLVKSSRSADLGNLESADLNSWEQGLRKLLTRYPEAEHVVPGHGEVGGLELIEHTLNLVRQQLEKR
jgi:metallo-beta-lactamase class B